MRSYVLPDFHPLPPDAAGIVTWVHIGDLHMVSADDQNYADLLALVTKINEQFASAISCVFLPGDNADNGSASAYQLVRGALDMLRVPWCAIVGDHDVHEKSFDHFLHYMEPMTHYTFPVGDLHFFALNAFDLPDPGSFTLLTDQLEWLEEQLTQLAPADRAVLLLHCYPSDLKQGGEKLRALVDAPQVLLIDMGHTHYNEVANDGKTLYTATRSTGQLEEGPVGFSVTNIDAGVVSWKFAPLSDAALIMITSPADERFMTSSSKAASGDALPVRVKAWGREPFEKMTATIGNQQIVLQPLDGSQVWQGTVSGKLADGAYDMAVRASTASGTHVSDSIRVRIGAAHKQIDRMERDADNALDAWPERGLIGTQLGPNKHGKKW